MLLNATAILYSVRSEPNLIQVGGKSFDYVSFHCRTLPHNVINFWVLNFFGQALTLIFIVTVLILLTRDSAAETDMD